MLDISKIFPFVRWSPVSADSLRMDLVAGATVALVLIPQSLAYAQLAGLPPYYGLYAAFLPAIIAALWGSSGQLSTGPVAVVSLLTASALAPYAETGSDEFIAMAILLAVLVGLFQLMLGILKLGVVVNFLSHPVILGFTNAAAIIIALSQFDKILGLEVPRSESFFGDIVFTLVRLGDAHLLSVAMGMLAFALVWAVRRYFAKLPAVLVAVVLTTIISKLMDYQGLGGKVVGEIPSGLPEFKLPELDFALIGFLLPNAVVIALVGFMEAISIAKAMAAKTKDRIDPNQELIGQGLSNIVGSFGQSYPVSGSFSRSALNLNAGSRTGMSSVFTGLLVLVTLLYLTPLIYHLPQSVLAVVIIMAVLGLLNFRSFKHAWQAQKHDGLAAVVTFVATLAFAPNLDSGIMTGVGLALGLYLYRTMRPRVALLGRHPDDGSLHDTSVFPDSITDDRIIAMRFDGSLYFANVAYFEDFVLSSVAKKPGATFILVVSDGINQIDASGEEMLHQLTERLKSQDITLVFSGIKRQVLAVMRNTGLLDAIGSYNIHATEEMALNYIYNCLRAVDADDPDFCPLKPARSKRALPEDRIPF